MKIGEYYTDGKIYIMIVGHDNTLPIWFIGLAKATSLGVAQCPFVPVSEDILLSFTGTLFPEGIGTPSPIDESIKMWLDLNQEKKVCFNISIPDIWHFLIDTLEKSGKKPIDFAVDGGIVLPICFPSWRSPEHLDQFPPDGMYLDMKCGEAYE
jgi:hypothetical protein